MNNGPTMHGATVRQFNHTADLMGLDPDVRKILSETANEILVNFPVKMDDGGVRVFTGYRIQHNNVMGPFAGGLRYHPGADLEDIRALAMRLTWKHALAGVPFGGAMGGVLVDPMGCSTDELERITRRFTFCLGNNIGPEYDIPSPELNTGPQIMAWILDTYLSTVPSHERNGSKHVVTGKPTALGGSLGRDKATGQGIVFLLEEWARERSFDLSTASFIVQGFDTVGSWASRLLGRCGARLLAVEDRSGAIANPAGLDPNGLATYMGEQHVVQGFPHGEAIDHEAFLSIKADIFIPAALENPVDARTASLLNVHLVAEGVNCATEVEGDLILTERGIEVIPDILCNAGGVLVHFFEWLQNRRSESWELDEVDRKLRQAVVGAYEEVKRKAGEFGVGLRTAALILALSRIENVYLKRGIFP